YNVEGRYDLVRFINTVQKAGLYAHLRIGPYVCAAWNFGGFPVWLKYVPGIRFRIDNEPFKGAMQKFTQKIVKLMKSENLFESLGGPIILSQIENKYQPAREAPRKAGEAYVQWAAQMAVGLNTGFLWISSIWLNQINTCNGFYCAEFSPNKPYKPTMWTEAWSGWFVEFGGTIPLRPVQDLAFVVACFIQKGVSFVNYYMFHGGTNFRLTAGGPFITISYDYDAPIDEYVFVPTATMFFSIQQSVDISPSESFLRRGQKPTLNVHPNGHAVHVSVNGKPSGTSYGIQKDTKFNSTGLVDLQAETNRIELLSIAVKGSFKCQW
ncbi:Beta-galactosidase 5, partial [Capsicum annuum]